MSLDPASPDACQDPGAFERFLTATIVTRCLDDRGPQPCRASDIEALIDRLSNVLRSAARSVTQMRRDPSSCLPRHKLLAVTAHVVDNLDKQIRVADLAAIVNSSPHHFSRQFRAATGLAPHQYVSHCRMRRAAQLLIDGEMSICAVAIEVGCVDQSHFANTFRRTFGCTPREFQRSERRLHQADAGSPREARAEHAACCDDVPGPGALEYASAASLVSCVQRCGPGERSSARATCHLRFDRPFTSTQESP